MSEDNKGKKKNALGRGLGALLDNSSTTKERKTPFSGAGASGTGNIGEIDISSIEVNPFQPRTDFNEEALNELAESIKVQGIIQPITVRKLSEGVFQLISGERRFQASKKAGLTKIPAYIREANDQQMLEMALIENIQRESLNAIEISLSYQRLMQECNLKQEELGDRVGKNRTTINNYLRLLKLPPDIQIALRDGKLSMGHARAIINIDNVSLQLDIFKKILSEDLSVRKVEELVRGLTEKKEKIPIGSNKVSPEISRLQDKLSSHFGTKVNIQIKNKDNGNISIPFLSTEDLNRILEILEV
jgi:ParB family chromosome partitioning protein